MTTQAIFDTTPISIDVWLFLVPFAVAMFGAEELRKWVVRATHRRHQRFGTPSPVAT